MAPCTRALMIVPPFLKYSAGPLLGPALLQSIARATGNECQVLDLNAHYIRPRVSKRLVRGNFIGDHDKPKGPRSLGDVEQEFLNRCILPALKENDRSIDQRSALFGFLSNAQVRNAAESMVAQDFGKWIRDVIGETVTRPPELVGLSLLHSGQVVPAAAVSNLARQLWPKALLVWGGPHISGLGRATLEKDITERRFAADVFVTGHAEQTFQKMLEDISEVKHAAKERPVVLSGEGKTVAPIFDNLDLYDEPLTLPAQSTLGCSYGRCAFCTYPSIESTPKKLDLSSSVGSVVAAAQSLGAGTSISLKDSLVTSTRLTEIGKCIRGSVKWSACTKLSSRLDASRLCELGNDGLATLEVGLESLLPETQKRVSKLQPESLYETFVADVAKFTDISLVVNYMVGFPWEDSAEAQVKLETAEQILADRLDPTRGRVELNQFELERMATMAKFPEVYGIDPERIRSWPWASVLEVSGH